jgi:hypothetical protein
MNEKVARAVGAGLGWGLGTGLAVGVTGALGGRGLRPLLKGAIKGGLAVAERATSIAAETGEVVQDLYHEARVERSAEKAARAQTRRAAMAGAPEVLVPRSS